MKFIQLPEQAKGYEDPLRECVRLRVSANTLKEQAKNLEEQANELFKGIADVAGFNAVETDQGTIRVITKAGSEKLDKNKLKDVLVKAGVDSDVVIAAFKKATTKGAESVYVGFFPPKGE